MNKIKKIVALVIVGVILMNLIIPVSATDSVTDSKKYTYTFDIRVDNPCNSNDMDRDAVCDFVFKFSYTTLNGYGSKNTETFSMSWDGNKNCNRNEDFLKKYFIRSNDNAYDTSFTMDFPGKLDSVHIKLNMDGGERLSFTVKQITCNGIRINSNTDYVSSAYYDSEADINCSMARSVIDATASPYFEGKKITQLTQSVLDEINADLSNVYAGQFVDQFGAVIDLSVLSKCMTISDGKIKQSLSHSDEVSMYLYTFYFTVENAVNLSDADYDAVDDFKITMDYCDSNGCGKSGSYCLDMSYDEKLGRNLNPDYLAHFVRNSDDEYCTSFSVWLPGLLSKVTCLLNMGSERLTVNFDKITLNGLAVNTEQDYVSSAVWDSEAEIECYVPAAKINVDASALKTADRTNLRDQYGALVSDTLYNKALVNAQTNIYHY